MSYDAEPGTEHLSVSRPDLRSDPRDPRTLQVLLHLAALDLTPSCGARFDFVQLLAAAREYAGEAFPVFEEDLREALARDEHFGHEGDLHWLL